MLSITRSEAALDEGTLIGQLFAYMPPRFFFKEHEQDVLNHALAGASDEQIAGTLVVTVEAIKARWLKIYDRVSEVDASLFPKHRATAGGRGAEKRSMLLRYLRDHLEELRPLKSPRKA